MVDNNQFIDKEAFLTRPPGFIREDYLYWKGKMEMYIKSTQYKLQLIITNGDIPISRPKAKWVDTNFAIMELNTKALYTFTCALSRNEYNNICRLKAVKEIQDQLGINCEGTEDVQLRKVSTRIRHYESFSKKE